MMGWGETGRALPFSQLPFPAGIWGFGDLGIGFGPGFGVHVWSVFVECGIGVSVGKGMPLFRGNAALPGQNSSWE